MTNRIRHIRMTSGSLSPTQAEVWITVFAESQTPTTEVRGRLMGPRCAYASTVEVAYPLRVPPGEHRVNEPSGITRCVVIPEASFWDTESPFLYQGPIELWQDGQCCDQRTVCYGLRALRLGKRGLLVNDQPLLLRGQILPESLRAACSEDSVHVLHQAGFNLLVASAADTTLDLWHYADHLGLLVLGRVSADDERIQQRLKAIAEHASYLGWLIESASLDACDWLPSGCLLGWTGDFVSPAPSLDGTDFLFGSPELARLGKPLLVNGEFHAASNFGVPLLGCVL